MRALRARKETLVNQRVQAARVGFELIGVDHSELKAHQRVWGRRAEVVWAVQKLNQDITSSIDGIIETSNE